MTKLVDMKIPKKSKSQMKKEIEIPYMDEKYPYGLILRFEKDQLDKLSYLKEKKVGDKCVLVAEGTVIAVRMSERSTGKKDHTVEIQINKAGIKPKVVKPINKMSPDEYKDYRRGGS